MPALQLQGQGWDLRQNVADLGLRIGTFANSVAGRPVRTGDLAERLSCDDSTGQGVGQVRPVFGDRNGNCLPHRIAVEVVGACHTGSAADKLRVVLTQQVDNGGAVINAGHLFRRVDQAVELDLHLVPGLELGGLGEDLAVRIQEVIADAPGGDHLIGLNAVLLHADDVPAGGKAGDRHGAVGGYGDAVSGKAVKAHLVGDGGAGYGDGAAFLRLKAVGCALVVKVIENVVLGIQGGGLGAQAIHHGIGLDGCAVRAHGDHEHTGELRPDSGQLCAAHALGMGHGVIGHQHDGCAVFVGGHAGHAAVVGIGVDGQNIAVVSIHVDNAVMHIRQGDLLILIVLNSLPVAEHMQVKGLSYLQVFIALLVDGQIHIAQVVQVLIEAVDRGLCIFAVPDVQVLPGNVNCLLGIPLAEGPVGHAIRVLNPNKVVIIVAPAASGNHRQGVCRAHPVCAFSDRCSFCKLISPVVAEGTGADGGALGRIHSDSGRGRNGSVQFNSAACLAPCLAYCSSHIIGSLVSYGGKGSLDSIALDKNAGGAGGTPVSGGARLGLAVHAVGAHHLVGDGVIRTLDPAAVGSIDPIGPAKGDGGGVLRHGDNDAAVILAGLVVALDPVVARRQLYPGVLQATVFAIGHGILAGQQVHAALDAADIAIQLQGRQLGAVQARQVHGDHGGLLDLGRGVHQRIDFLVPVAHGGEIPGKAVGHGEGGLTLFIGDSAVNNGHSAGLGIHPGQLDPLQGLGRGLQLGRSLVFVAFPRNHKAGDGDGGFLAHLHFGRSVHPGVIVRVHIPIGHDIKVYHIAVYKRGIDKCRAVVSAVGGFGTVIGIALIHTEPAGRCAIAEDLGDHAGAAHSQELPSCFLGKCITEDQLVGLDQGVQGGHALQRIGKAVLLGSIGRHFHLLKSVEIAVRHLGAERHLHGGRGLLGNGDLILVGLSIFVHAGPGGIAALDGDDRSVGHRDLSRALVLRAVHAGADLEVLVAGGGSDLNAADLGGQLQGIAVCVLVKGGGQLAIAEGQGLDGGVFVAPAAAQVIAIGAGVHDADLVAALQLAVRHGKGAEAFVGEPVVEGSHPAGHKAAVKLFQTVDLADVIAFSAGLGVALGFQRLGDTAHHGGILGELHPGIHQRAGPGRSFTIHRFCEGSVFHDDTDLAQVNGRCQHGGGHQGQGHHQCQQQG